MRKLALAAAASIALLPTIAKAEYPIVVELYTSQGCSSCPPADQLLAQLATHDYVIALALHVDYWDYLGWKDIFAKPAFSDRQRRYARVWNERSVYTPQMVVQGTQYMVGSRGDEVQRQIMQLDEQPLSVSMNISSGGGALMIELAPVSQEVGASTVYLVGYIDSRDVEIRRGENRGKTIRYVNIVETWETIGEWDGASAGSIHAQTQGDLNYVVILQEAGQGRILAAARLDP